MGLLFYLTPAMQMTWGVFVGHEPMPPARWLGFALIWLALMVFSADALLRARRQLGRVDENIGKHLIPRRLLRPSVELCMASGSRR